MSTAIRFNATNAAAGNSGSGVEFDSRSTSIPPALSSEITSLIAALTKQANDSQQQQQQAITSLCNSLQQLSTPSASSNGVYTTALNEIGVFISKANADGSADQSVVSLGVRESLRILVKMFFFSEAKNLHRYVLNVIQSKDFPATLKPLAHEFFGIELKRLVKDMLSSLSVPTSSNAHEETSQEITNFFVLAFLFEKHLHDFFHPEFIDQIEGLLEYLATLLHQYTFSAVYKDGDQIQILPFKVQQCSNTIRLIHSLLQKNEPLLSRYIQDSIKIATESNNNNNNNSPPPGPYQHLSNIIAAVFCTLENDFFTKDIVVSAGLLLVTFVKLIGSQEHISEFFWQSMFHDGQTTTATSTTTTTTRDPYETLLRLSISDMQARFNKFTEKARLATYMAILNLCDAETFTLHKRASQHETSLLFDGILPHVLQSCETVLEPNVKLLAIQVLDVILHRSSQIIAEATNNNNNSNSNSNAAAAIYALLRQNFRSLFSSVNAIIFNNWESPIAAIADELRNIFESLLKLHDKMPAELHFDIDQMALELVDADFLRRGKYASLTILLPRLSADDILKKRPRFLTDILMIMGNMSVNTMASHFLKKFAMSLYAELTGDKGGKQNKAPTKQQQEGVEKWQRLCLSPVLDVLILSFQQADETLHRGISTYVLPKIFDMHKSNFSFIMSLLNERMMQSTELSKSNECVLAYVKILKTARSLGLVDGPDEIKAHKDWNFRLLEEALTHEDLNVRLDALSFVVSSKKLTNLPTQLELQLVQRFIMLNLNNGTGVFRESFTSTMRRFLNRLRSSINRTGKQKTQKTQNEQDTAQLNSTMDFLLWLARYLQNSLYPAAQDNRRFFALELMKCLVSELSTSGESALSFTSDPSADVVTSTTLVTSSNFEVYSVEAVQSLLGSLVVSWDRLRILAYEVLMLQPAPLPGFSTTEGVLQLIRWASVLIKSARARESDAGSYLFRLIFNKYVVQLGWRFKIDTTNSWNIVETTTGATKDNTEAVLAFLQEVSDMLERNTNEFETNSMKLGASALSQTLHGTLIVARYILNDLSFTKINAKYIAAWKQMIAKLLAQFYRVGEITLTLLKILFPLDKETGLKEDAEEADEADTGGEGFDFVAEEQTANNEQERIVSSWLALREVTAIHSSLVSRVPLFASTDNLKSLSKDCLITTDNISAIGSQFLDILLSMKHPGLLHSAQEGFTELSKRLLASDIPELGFLTKQWLEFLFSKVMNREITTLRRSHGLPYIFTSLLSAEPAGVPCVLFPRTLDFLMNVLSSRSVHDNNYTDADAENKVVPLSAQVHSLNILKTIFEESALSSAVIPYVAKGFIIALNGFSSPYWAIRNSSTLLFSSILLRSVGSKKTVTTDFDVQSTTDGEEGDESGDADADDEALSASSINVARRDFFARYPELRPFLLQQLELATRESSSSDKTSTTSTLGQHYNLHPSLYPILLLLSRLPPALTEDENDPHGMSAFIGFILKCASLTHYMARSMSARALIPLVPMDRLAKFIAQLMSELPQDKKQVATSNNATHGKLMQIQSLIKRLSRVQQPNDKESCQQILAIVKIIEAKFAALATTKCYLNRALFFSIIEEALSILLPLMTSPSNNMIDANEVASVNFLVERISKATRKSLTEEPKTTGVGLKIMRPAAASLYLRSMLHLSSESDEQKQQQYRDQIHSLLLELMDANKDGGNIELLITALRLIERHCRGKNKWINTAAIRRKVIHLVFTEEEYTVLVQSLKTLNALFNKQQQSSGSSDGASALTVDSALLRELKDYVTATRRADYNNSDSSYYYYYYLQVCWNHFSKKLHEGNTNYYIQAQAQSLMGLLVSQFLLQQQHEQQQNASEEFNRVKSTILAEWFQLLNADSMPFKPVILRMACRKSIANSQVLTQLPTSLEVAKLYIGAHNVLIRLLQDEEPDVRTQCARFVSAVVLPQQHAATNCQSALALEKLFDHLTTSIASICDGSKEGEQYLCALVQSLLQHFLLEPEELETLAGAGVTWSGTGEKIFDKDTDNDFEEKAITVQLASLQLRRLLAEHPVAAHYVATSQDVAAAAVAPIQRTLVSSLNNVLDTIEKSKGLWVGGLSYHKDVFIVLYKLVMGLWTLSWMVLNMWPNADTADNISASLEAIRRLTEESGSVLRGSFYFLHPLLQLLCNEAIENYGGQRRRQQEADVKRIYFLVASF